MTSNSDFARAAKQYELTMCLHAHPWAVHGVEGKRARPVHSTMIMTTPHSTADLLEHLQLILPCNVCGTAYTIPASLVRDSQQAIADGCCGSGAITCDAEFYAGLLAPEAIAELARAWEAFRHSAEHLGGLGVALHDAVVMARPAELDRLALQRWEDDGGNCPRATVALDRA